MKTLCLCLTLLTFFGLNRSQKTYPSKVSYKAKLLYEIKLDMDPTSVRLLLDPSNSDQMSPLYDMVYMSTQPRSEIRRIPDVTLRVNKPEFMTQQQVIFDQTTIKTPNSVGVLPDNSIDLQPPYVWWIATGLFEAGSGISSNDGGIYLADMSANVWAPQSIYVQPRSGFTHVEWTDMNLDGKSDCITIRGSANRASLIWLAQPRTGSSEWTPNFISNSTIDVGGTDFKTMEVLLPQGRGKRKLIVVAGRRTATLSGFWIDDIDNDWTQTTRIRYVEISRGEAYVNVEIVDLNGDGNKDILTSVAAYGGKPGRLLAFETPKHGLGAGIWRKRILHEWIPTFVSYRTLTPGPSYPFFIKSAYEQAEYKPHIVVSGADDGNVYILSPDSWSPFIWTYSMEKIHSGNTPIGIPAILDVEGDGNPELFIPTGESIFVMRYMPSSATSFRLSTFLVCLGFMFTFGSQNLL